MESKKKTRREFLTMSATGIAGIVLAVCAPAPTPVIASTPAAPRAIPTLTAFKEAPALAALVKAGKLPSVELRLPTVPLTLTPVGGLGRYGGRLRSYWPGTGWNGHWQESQYGHSALRWIDDGLGIAPGMCDKWAANIDNTEWTLHIREGLKWSDGHVCTVDDILFWWVDLTQATDPANPDSVPDFGQDANGNLAIFTKVDDYTLKITYGTPAPLTAKRLAMWVNANIGPRWIAPKHYLSQFHPKYNPAVLNFNLFNQKCVTFTNPDLPTLNSWILTTYEAGKSMTAERNPYYYAVDTAGNQLPYIDGTDWVAAADRAVEFSLVSQGLIDHNHFNNFTVSDIATLRGTQNAGNYDVVLWDSGSGTGMMYFWNYDTAAPKLRALYRTPKFKQALSFALNRPAIQNAVYGGTGMLTTGTMSPKAFEFNFNFIGTVANYPRPKIVSRRLKGVPKREELALGGFDNPWIIPYPAVTNPETWSFKPATYMPIVQSKK
jgi:peptide/nickel transport system substrate-binding protein